MDTSIKSRMNVDTNIAVKQASSALSKNVVTFFRFLKAIGVIGGATLTIKWIYQNFIVHWFERKEKSNEIDLGKTILLLKKDIEKMRKEMATTKEDMEDIKCRLSNGAFISNETAEILSSIPTPRSKASEGNVIPPLELSPLIPRWQLNKIGNNQLPHTSCMDEMHEIPGAHSFQVSPLLDIHRVEENDPDAIEEYVPETPDDDEPVDIS